MSKTRSKIIQEIEALQKQLKETTLEFKNGDVILVEAKIVDTDPVDKNGLSYQVVLRGDEDNCALWINESSVRGSA
jgi:hypothetical protein